MADSENSRTLPAITRRKMMYGPAAIVAVATIPADDALALPSPHDQTDPVVLLSGANGRLCMIKLDHPELRSMRIGLVIIGGRADGYFRA